MKNNKGITLVALVVTIIVLLILAAVSINLVLGENGIITRAKQAKQNTEIAVKNEETDLENLLNQMDLINAEIVQYTLDELLNCCYVKSFEMINFFIEDEAMYSVDFLGEFAIEKDGQYYEAYLKDKKTFNENEIDRMNYTDLNVYLVKKIDTIPEIYSVMDYARDQDDVHSIIVDESEIVGLIKYNENYYIGSEYNKLGSKDGNDYFILGIYCKEAKLENFDSEWIKGATAYCEKSNKEIEWVNYQIMDSEIRFDYATKKVIASLGNVSLDFNIEEKKNLLKYLENKNRKDLELESGTTYKLSENGEDLFKVQLINQTSDKKEYIIKSEININDISSDMILGYYGYKEDNNGNVVDIIYAVENEGVGYAYHTNRQTGEVYYISRLTQYELNEGKNRNVFYDLKTLLENTNYKNIPYETFSRASFGAYSGYNIEYNDSFFSIKNLNNDDIGKVYTLEIVEEN